MRLVAAMVVLGAVTLTLVSPAGATNECRGLNPCVAVAGPWVVVPSSGEKAQYQADVPEGLCGRRHRRRAERPRDRPRLPRHLGRARLAGDHDLADARLSRCLYRHGDASAGVPPPHRLHPRHRRWAADAHRGSADRPAGRADRAPGRDGTCHRDEADRRVVPGERAAGRLVRDPCLRDAGTALGRARRLAVGPRARRRGHRRRRCGCSARAGHRPGRGRLRRWTMTFGHPCCCSCCSCCRCWRRSTSTSSAGRPATR